MRSCLSARKYIKLHSVLLQVVLWSLGDHVTSLSNHAQGTFDGKRERLSSRLTLKVRDHHAFLMPQHDAHQVSCHCLFKVHHDYVHQCVQFSRTSMHSAFMRFVIVSVPRIRRKHKPIAQTAALHTDLHTPRALPPPQIPWRDCFPIPDLLQCSVIQHLVSI